MSTLKKYIHKCALQFTGCVFWCGKYSSIYTGNIYRIKFATNEL